MDQTCNMEMLTGLGIVGAVFIFALIIMAISLLPTIFYLLSLQKAFTRCRPQNRSMSPGMVWLLLIPFFGIIWHFFIIIGLSDSLEREFSERGKTVEPKPGRSLGLAMCILNACSIIPYVGVLTSLASLVVWIIYWIKIVDYSSRLQSEAPVAPPQEEPPSSNE